jgi:PTH1 family peptidyl-tRNA hydrolase
MNLSGESIRKIVDFYKIPLQDWSVIYDDFSLEFGKIRFRDKGSAG